MEPNDGFATSNKKIFSEVVDLGYNHGCQNPDLDPTILQFYDLTYPKRSKSFKDICGRSGSVGSYNSDDPKQSWFLVIFFNLIKGSVGPK